ncbi:hypothetical protein WA026_018118 [Henosepilachna vigintioctopunctata]|uniref:Uncharacterized protein n=1 Tax=Henosepilachna vigintioctopunctata TaxID=420089 RepID=A0AAW1UQZ3_9CUCU
MSRQLEDQDIPEDGSEESIIEYVCDNCDTYTYEILQPCEIPTHCAYENALQQYKIILNKLHTDLNDRDMLISELRDQHIRMQTYCRNCLLQIKNLKTRYKTALHELEHFKRQYETQKEQRVDVPTTSNQELESLLKAEVQRWNKENMQIHNQMQTMNSDIQKLIQIVKNESKPATENDIHNQVGPIEKLVASQTAILTVLVSKVQENVNAIKEMKRCPSGGCGKSTHKTEDNSYENSKNFEMKETQTEPLNEFATSPEMALTTSKNGNEISQPTETKSERSFLSESTDEIFNNSPENMLDTVKEEDVLQKDDEYGNGEKNHQVLDEIVKTRTIEPLNADKQIETIGKINAITLTESIDIPVKARKCYCGNTELCPEYMTQNSENDSNAHQTEAPYKSINVKENEAIINPCTPLAIKMDSDTNHTEFDSNIEESIRATEEQKYSVELQDEQVSSDELKVTESKLSDKIDVSQLPECCRNKEPNEENLSPCSKESILMQTEETNVADINPTSAEYITPDQVKTTSNDSENEELVDESGDKKLDTDLITASFPENDSDTIDVKSNSEEPISTERKETYSEEPIVAQVASNNYKAVECEKRVSFSPTSSIKSDTKEPISIDNKEKQETCFGEPTNERSLFNDPSGAKSSNEVSEVTSIKDEIEPENERVLTPLDNNQENVLKNGDNETKPHKSNVPEKSKVPKCCKKNGQNITEELGSNKVILNEDEKEPKCCKKNGQNIPEELSCNKVIQNADELPDSDKDLSSETEPTIVTEKEVVEEVLPVKHFDPVHQRQKEDISDDFDKREVPANEPEIPPFLEQFLSTVTTEIDNIKNIMEKRDALLKELKGDFQNNQEYVSHENSELITKIQTTLNDLPNWICAHSVFNEIQNRLSEVEQIMIKMQSIINELKSQFDCVELNGKNAIPTTENVNTKNEAEIQILNELLNKMKTLEKYVCGCSKPSKDESQIKDQIMATCSCKTKKNK